MSDPQIIELPDSGPYFKAIGEGISAFAGIESSLAFLFMQMMKPAPPKLALITFDYARQINTKCRLVKEIGTEVLEQAHMAELDTLMRRVESRIHMRHKLAHWNVGLWRPGGPAESAAQALELRPGLMPPQFSKGNMNLGFPDDPLNLEQIAEFRDLCHKIASDIFQFLTRLDQDPTPV